MKKRILIAGGSGLIGLRLSSLLKHQYDIHILTRGASRLEDQIHYHQWNLHKSSFDVDPSLSFYAVVNLTGAGIADKRWTEERKKVLIDSRVNSAKVIAKLIDALEQKPAVYVGASAIGYYGHRGDEWIYEDGQANSGFLSECCVQWEEAHQALSNQVNRFSILRIGIVLSMLDGALPKLISPAKLGGSGYFGDGQAFYPWIHIDDVCGMILKLIEDDSLNGVFNGTSLEPVRLKDMAKLIKKVFAPYAIVLPIPALGLKLLMGDMSEMLLNSTRVSSKRWNNGVFPYKYPDLEHALLDLKERKV